MSKEIELNPSEVEFLEKLKESKYSVVFKVRFRERTCVMKVVSNYSHPVTALSLMIKSIMIGGRPSGIPLTGKSISSSPSLPPTIDYNRRAYARGALSQTSMEQLERSNRLIGQVSACSLTTNYRPMLSLSSIFQTCSKSTYPTTHRNAWLNSVRFSTIFTRQEFSMPIRSLAI